MPLKEKPRKCNPKQPPVWTKQSVYKAWVCPGLWKHTGPEQSTGLSFFVLTKLFGEGAGERRMYGVVFKRSQKDKGILLNYCLFCGTSFTKWLGVGESKMVPARKPLRKSA
jgi:hypothetical protein